MTLAASPGFELGSPYVLGLLFAGVAVFAAIGALSHEHGRAFSSALIYLGLGIVAAFAISLMDLEWLDPVDDQILFERGSELAVIVALFSAGLKLDRALRWHEWTSVVRLLAITMPLTIGAITLFGTEVMGLSLGAAIILGAALAPTDPVLAGDIGVGPPGDEDEHEPNFSVTGEAGLNDGLAFPFIFLGAFVAGEGGTGWIVEWVSADVLYGVAGGLLAGIAIGYGIASLAVPLRDRELLSEERDGWLAPAAVLVIYGATEALGMYGFLAAFAGGLAFRRYESGHEYNEHVHRGSEVVEKFAELAVIIIVGATLTWSGLGTPGLEGWLLVPLLLVLIRPLATLVALLRSDLPASERLFVGWFGVRGIGSIYYAAVAVGLGVLTDAEARTITWTVIAVVAVSIVVHGITAGPLSRRLLRH